MPTDGGGDPGVIVGEAGGEMLDMVLLGGAPFLPDRFDLVAELVKGKGRAIHIEKRNVREAG